MKWLTRRKAAEVQRKKGKILPPADGKTSNGNKRWSREELDKT